MLPPAPNPRPPLTWPHPPQGVGLFLGSPRSAARHPCATLAHARWVPSCKTRLTSD